jgi:hypothetical protein
MPGRRPASSSNRENPQAAVTSNVLTLIRNACEEQRDLVGPPLKTDLIGGRRNNCGYPAVSVISTNGDVYASDVDLLSDHVGELFGTAALFHRVISPSRKNAPSRSAV